MKSVFHQKTSPFCASLQELFCVSFRKVRLSWSSEPYVWDPNRLCGERHKAEMQDSAVDISVRKPSECCCGVALSSGMYELYIVLHYSLVWPAENSSSLTVPVLNATSVILPANVIIDHDVSGTYLNASTFELQNVLSLTNNSI